MNDSLGAAGIHHDSDTMARLSSAPLSPHVQGALDYEDAASEISRLKDAIVGHVQQKQYWVERGAVESLVRILRSPRSRADGAENPDLSRVEWLRVQSLQLLASLAKGGAAFLPPILIADSIADILQHICPSKNPRPVVVAALRALSSIVNATSLAASAPSDLAALADALFQPCHLASLVKIVAADFPTGSNFSEQKCLVCGLVYRLCRAPEHQHALADAGLLDVLASSLAGCIFERGEIVPGANGLDADFIPRRCTRGASLREILEAISVLIEESRLRGYMLTCSPWILGTLTTSDASPLLSQAAAALDEVDEAERGSANAGAMDLLLPVLPSRQPRNTWLPPWQFPTVAGSGSKDTTGRGKSAGGDARLCSGNSGDADPEEAESPLIPWLIYLVKNSDDLSRVMAASVLASLVRAGLARPDRDVLIATIVFPVLWQLLKDSDPGHEALASALVTPETEVRWAILERVPAVLARLVGDSRSLQQRLYDLGALQAVCKLLRDSYEPMTTLSNKSEWSATRRQEDEHSNGLATRRLGPPGRRPLCRHKLRVREGALKFMAVMTSLKEDLRTATVEQDALPYIAESLAPCPCRPQQAKDRARCAKRQDEEVSAAGKDSLYCDNPADVLVAACHVVRTLSRSISILRTSLEDYGTATAILRLLTYDDKRVQIAASGAVCNLVCEVSPMREPLIKAGILDVLCQQAHSADPGLGLNALWALKHLIHGVDMQLKKRCLEQLGPGWLMHLIKSDKEDEALHARMSQRQDDDAVVADDKQSLDEVWIWPAKKMWASRRWWPPALQRFEAKLKALSEAELDPCRKARNDDLAMQEQGLNFIRNLLLPSSKNTADPADMEQTVDFVLSEFGEDQLFETLAQKLRVRVLHALSRRQHMSWPGRTGGEARVLYPQARVIEAVVCILVHIAACVPRHRQLVVAQTDLLKQLVALYNSREMDVRRAMCHLAANLAWQEDSQDANGAKQRRAKLKSLGFLAKLESLEASDGELDVRERAREAACQMRAGIQ